MANNIHPEATPVAAVAPCGLNHLVINVRDMEESHRFWTEIIGMKQVGELMGRPSGAPRRGTMRFYSADHGGGRMNHHDIALVETPELPALPADGSAPTTAISHIAIALPGREAWLRQLAFLQSRGIKFERRVEHGMTHSLYIRDPNGYSLELLYELPREVWEGDIQAALNHYVALPTEGAEALKDRADDVPVFARPDAV
jgi:catechol 2,3-dioxygenase-like lactoylglutathione lyase family enzyme